MTKRTTLTIVTLLVTVVSGIFIILWTIRDNKEEVSVPSHPPISNTSKLEVTAQESNLAKKTVVNLANLLRTNYVDPDLGAAAADTLLANESDGRYDHFFGHQLSNKLTNDVMEILKDKHFVIVYDPNLKNQRQRSEEMMHQEYLEEARKNKYGIRNVEILEGNIGFLSLQAFLEPSIAKDPIIDAMKKLQNTNGIIIDLRGNTGGSPEMVQLLSSYFFGETPVHLNSLYFRNTGQTTEFWTLNNIEGKRMPDVPVYILTDKQTFSAGEEFAYNMQQLNRGTIVGEVTGGGANPGSFMPVSEEYAAFIPTGKAVNPITGTNWEGVGVKPDITTSSGKAFDEAYSSLRSLLK